MIVKMKKLDLLLYHKEQEKFLENLRGLGVMHITSECLEGSPVVQSLAGDAARTARAISALKKAQKEKNIAASPAQVNAAEMVARYEECELVRDKLEQESASLKKDLNTLTPWGNFDPQSVKRLSEVGVGIKFYTAAAKKFESLDKSELKIEQINFVDGVVFFAVVFRGEEPELVGIELARLPEIPLTALKEKIAALETRRIEINAEIDKMAGHTAALENLYGEQIDKLKFEEARLSMPSHAEGKLLKLSGWVAVSDEAKLSSFLKDYPAYVAFSEPATGDDVPVKLKNDKFSKLFEPILGLYSLPGYREIDAAPFVAPFFALFVGLCLGDAGYGFLIALGSAIAFFKVSPKMKTFAGLGLAFGFSAMICGVLLNSIFGQPLFGGEGVAAGTSLFPTGVEKFAPLASVEINGETTFPAMSLAIVIGFVQVFFGILIQAYIKIREDGFMACLQPISGIFMATGGVIVGAHVNFLNLGIGEFAVGRWKAGAMLLDVPLVWGQGLMYGGLVMLLLFNDSKNIFLRPLAGLWALYNFASGFLSNVLSYLRLFALGLAGGLLGGAINGIAYMFITNADGVVNYASIGMAATVLILVGGHALNIALASLGAFVHPLRLTFVEFYGALGFQGGSKPFVPFRKVEK